MAIMRFNNDLGKPSQCGEIEIMSTGGEEMNKQFEIFNYNNLGQVRTYVDENGDKWFCLSDVSIILNIKNSNDARKRLDEKGIDTIYTLTQGGRQELVYINEGNLMELIFTSRKPEAKNFRSWVCQVVLPTLNKKGKYTIGDENKPQQTLSPADSLRQLADFMDSTNNKFNNIDKEINILKETFNRVHNNMLGYGFYTISGFAKSHNIPTTYGQSGEIAKEAIAYCRDYGFPIDSKPGYEPDTFINAYPYDVLKVVFEEYFDINL